MLALAREEKRNPVLTPNDPGSQLLQRRSVEGQRSGHEDVQHHAQRPDIGLKIENLDKFHLIWWTNLVTKVRQIPPDLVTKSLYLGSDVTFAFEELRRRVGWTPAPRGQQVSLGEVVAEAKIRQFDVVLRVEEQVFGLQVTMNDTLERGQFC